MCYKYPAANRSGGIAQLGERRVRIAKARGSNPLTSTSVSKSHLPAEVFEQVHGRRGYLGEGKTEVVIHDYADSDARADARMAVTWLSRDESNYTGIEPASGLSFFKAEART